MKQNKNIFPSLGIAAALLIATMFASCTKAELEAPVVKQGAEIRFGIEKNGISKPITKSGSKSDSRVLVNYDPNDPCSLGLSMTVVDGIETPKSHLPATKGAQVSQKEQLTAFDVVSYFYADESAEDGSLVFADEVSDGVNTSKKTYYWPSFGVMNFIATYPATLFRNDDIKTIADQQGHPQSFTYTIPQAVEEQQDIMIAMTNDVDCTEGAPVPLQFKHLLAAVQFKVGEMQFIQINTLKITGVYGGEISFEYDSNNHTWIPSYNTTKTFDYDLSSVISETSGLIAGDEITSNSNSSILLVAPQRLPDSAKLVVDWTEVITGVKPENPAEISLAGQNWEAGKTTIYSIAISGKDFTVTIPRPEDQDAHYIMLDMEYDLSDPDIIKYIEKIDITARWKTDENGNDISGDTGSSDKRNISLKFNNEDTDLSHTQKQGYWTDWQYLKKITVVESGDDVTSSTVGPVRQSDGNLIGSSTLTLNGEALSSSGNIILFIEENNGTTDREGELVFTATMKETGNKVIIATGLFKQLCPSWNDSNIGVERIEDGTTHPYGFNYSRTVKFTNPGNDQSSIFGIGILKWLSRRSNEEGVENIVQQDNIGFVTFEYREDSFLFGAIKYEYLNSITLNYGALNNVSNVASSDDGLTNTKALYNFTGGTDLNQVESDIRTDLGWKESISEGSLPEDYAAYVALSRNRMYELVTEIWRQEENKAPVLQTTTYTAVLYKDGIDGLTGNDIIEWYLPSKVEAENLLETGLDSNGKVSDVIDNLNGNYWSSTAMSDTDALACRYTFFNNVFSASASIDRDEENIVRAVRKKPTAN